MTGEENSKYLGLSPRHSSEMANLPTSEQKNPKCFGIGWCKSMCCMEINQNFCDGYRYTADLYIKIVIISCTVYNFFYKSKKCIPIIAQYIEICGELISIHLYIFK